MKYHKWIDNIEIRDTPDWQTKYPLGPVHFDLRCKKHNIEITNLSPTQLPDGKTKQLMQMFPCCYGKNL